MPSSNERALEKAKTLPVDGLILDLEDAVAPDAKPAARDNACAAAASGDYGRREVTIRVNGMDTEWHADDLAAACAAGPDAIVVPKVELARTPCSSSSTAMARHGAPEHTKLWAMVETPYAMLHAEEIAAASDRLTVLVMGTNDLAKELYAEHVPGRQPLLTGLGLALLAARATGKAIIDGVYNDVKDTDGFLAECRQGREMGFDGKTLIHPGQVAGANEAFAPVEKAVEDARGILQAWEDGRGLRRRHLQRPDDREPARRVRPAGAVDARGDPGARGRPGLTRPARGARSQRVAATHRDPGSRDLRHLSRGPAPADLRSTDETTVHGGSRESRSSCPACASSLRSVSPRSSRSSAAPRGAVLRCRRRPRAAPRSRPRSEAIDTPDRRADGRLCAVGVTAHRSARAARGGASRISSGSAAPAAAGRGR